MAQQKEVRKRGCAKKFAQAQCGMDTKKAIKLAGSVKKLAELLGITHQAVYAWGETLPELQMYRLRALKPRWFKK